MARFPPHPERRPAVVTGASSGIGAATARALSALGHPVALGARRQKQCEELAAELRTNGAEAVAIPLDVADTESTEAFCEQASAALGEIEIVVSNAANNAAAPVLDTTPDDFERTLRTNLAGAHRVVTLLGAGMVKRQRGDLVFVSSDVVNDPRPAMSAYVASKAGLEGYVRTLQRELEGTGVRASLVRPGPTLTGMGFDWEPQLLERVLADWVRWGLARHDAFLRPKSIAEAVAFVVSAPRGTHYATVEVQPEAPLGEGGS